MGYYDLEYCVDNMTTNTDFANMLQAFLTAQQNVAQEQQNMMRQFLTEQARARTTEHDRRASQAPAGPDMSDSDVDEHDDDYHVRDKGRLVSKYLKPDTFNGDMAKWDDWAFKLKRSINTMNRDVCRLMTIWESREEEIEEADNTSREFRQRSAELYDILCERCEGEALMIIRQVGDMEGIKAWQKLFHRYNPRTMARGLRMLSEVVNPQKAKSLTEVETLVSKWEDKVKRLEAQFQESVSDKMRMAIFTNMMPVAIQDYIYTHADKETKYQQLREKVQAMVNNKVSINTGPVPMDIGDVKGHDEDHHHHDHYDYYGAEDYEIDWIGEQCRNCGGYGHYARECPTKSKGKGKGFDKGKGKGLDKGKGKGKPTYNYDVKGGYGNFKGKGVKGKGKGYQGSCWNCGKVGHKASECNARAAYLVEEEDMEEQVEGVGGVWEVLVAGVAAEEAQRRARWGPMSRTTKATTTIGVRDCQTLGFAKPTVTGKTTTTTTPTSSTTRASRNTKNNTTTWAQIVAGGKTVYPPGLEKPCTKIHNRFEGLQVTDDYDVDEINEVHACDKHKWTRPSSMTFNVASVTKPLASAAQVVASGNRIVLDPRPEESFVENVRTGERMRLREQKGVYVFDVRYHDGEEGTITLDSGAGVSVWPKDMADYAAEMLPKKPNLKMVAANGTPIENYGRAKVVLRGRKPVFTGPSQ